MKNWRPDGITVAMPKIYVPDGGFVGKQVVIHMCEYHEDCDPAEGCERKDVSLTGNCNCKLKGRTVTITGEKETPRARFYRSTCYTIAESKNLIHESEFSPESQSERPGIVLGYILEGQKNYFLTLGYSFVKRERVIDGYVFNTGLIKTLLKSRWKANSVPTRAYPAEYDTDKGSTKVVGDALSWEQLRELILVK